MFWLNFFKCQSCELEWYELIAGKARIEPLNWVIYYKFMNETDDVSKQVLHREIKKWFFMRNDLFSPVRFERTDDEKTAQIKIFFGQHVAPYPFKKTTLAYVPSTWSLQHNIYFNDNFVREEAYDLDIVIAHELWHVFWYWHSKFRNSIMYAIYQKIFEFTQDVIDHIKSFYWSILEKTWIRKKVTNFLRDNKVEISKRLTRNIFKRVFSFYEIEMPKWDKEDLLEYFCDFIDKNYK